MKVKVSTASGPVLDWMVAKCEGITNIDKWGGVWVPMPKEPHFNEAYSPSTNWSQGGPIIERERYTTNYLYGIEKWEAYHQSAGRAHYGPTPLIAACRCFVASKLGEEVEVPDELA